MTMSKSMQATAHKKPLVVIKLGGSMLKQLSDAFIESLKELMESKNIIFVHGGGPEINEMLEKLQIKSDFYEGQRKTTAEVLEIAEMVLAGKMNKFLTTKLQKHHINALGLSGCDGQLIQASFLNEKDLGFVGKVDDVNISLLHALLDLAYIPVVAPLGKTNDGQTLNINADVCAAAIAEKMQAEQLIFVTNVPGILKDGVLIEEASENFIYELIDKGIIYGGMIPKVKSALQALSNSLKEVMIVSGNNPIIHNGKMLGTKISKKQEVVV
ncbi:acetylglutamate kinase [Aeribacillus alveayuensis]|uniref:Acetylglutamate kinase n=1 Tax=Aeribacillus alveayuensis TaxID=279215 RepID=A0ABT9VN57_9BACI|nr:acetylglutamate kinase [Bacillus alveayuensis]